MPTNEQKQLWIEEGRPDVLAWLAANPNIAKRWDSKKLDFWALQYGRHEIRARERAAKRNEWAGSLGLPSAGPLDFGAFRKYRLEKREDRGGFFSSGVGLAAGTLFGGLVWSPDVREGWKKTAKSLKPYASSIAKAGIGIAGKAGVPGSGIAAEILGAFGGLFGEGSGGPQYQLPPPQAEPSGSSNLLLFAALGIGAVLLLRR